MPKTAYILMPIVTFLIIALTVVFVFGNEFIPCIEKFKNSQHYTQIIKDQSTDIQKLTLRLEQQNKSNNILKQKIENQNAVIKKQQDMISKMERQEIIIKSNKYNDKVYINGKYAGATPVTFTGNRSLSYSIKIAKGRKSKTYNIHKMYPIYIRHSF